MNDKAPQATNIKDAQTLINQLWEITRVQVKTIDVLTQQVNSLTQQVDVLTLEVNTLKEKLSKNSNNSSKPPSSDGYSKPAPKSLRKKSGKPSGGQRGHKGQTLKMIAMPNIVEKYDITSCTHCCADLSHAPVIDVERRQVFDLPPVELEVTEHQAQIKQCTTCGKSNKAKFPVAIGKGAQYGTNIQAILTYFNQYQL
ncbi:DUF6444 domain-containing protein [Psychromonas sp.]|nr:DUF6444 domain-containing protein [Psychromonas sp.]